VRVEALKEELSGRNDLFRVILAFVFQLHFSGDAGKRRVDIAHAGADEVFAVKQRSALRVGDDEVQGGDGEPLGDAGALVDLLVFAGDEGDTLDDLSDPRSDLGPEGAAVAPAFLFGDGDGFLNGLGVVRADLGGERDSP
jgi:hypothetical protein